MTRKIFFMLAAAGMACSLQARAGVQPASRDSVRTESCADITRMFQPEEPSFHKGVLVTSPWSGNWFVSLQGGATAFIGKPIGCADLFDRVEPTLSVSFGKWFTPQIGARFGYGGWQFRDCMLASDDFHHFHADLMWNLLGSRYGKVENPRWGIVPYVGLGLVYNPRNGHKPFAVSYGVQGQYRICNRLTALLEIGNVSTFQDFDGYGRTDRFGDNMLSASAGISLTIGKTGWKRAIDATPYIRQNEWLRGYVSRLAESNRRYGGQHDRDTRSLEELKKILAIEGLLDKYAGLFDDREDLGHGYPKNDYSGLNSLRARLKNRHWDGKSPLAGDSLTIFPVVAGDVANDNAGKVGNADGMDAGSLKCTGMNGDTIPTCNYRDYLALMSSGKGCIGSPVFFFFELGTTRLTDRSQMVNLDELARVAKKYGLSVTVAGAADAATGTADANSALSVSRAEFIATELERRGVSAECITKVGKGGISDYSPVEANRHTKVMLHMKR